MALTVPEGAPTKTNIYTDLRGVDFSQDASLVDRQHSPDMVNMISDEGGSPVKRKGWEVLSDNPTYNIKNLFHFTSNDEDYYVCCYKAPPLLGSSAGLIGIHFAFYDPATGAFDPDDLMAGVTDFEVNTAFFSGDSLYIMYYTGQNWGFKRAYVENGVKRIADVEPKVPIILINRDPVTGGGVAYYDYNLLTSRRSEQFKAANTTTQFLLSSTSAPSNVKVEWLDENGNWNNDSTATWTASGNKYYAKITTGHNTPDANADNIRVTYTAELKEPETVRATKIYKCTNHGFYSHGGLDQVFVTGNPDFPNYIWYSDYGDPSYFPDLNYIIAGNAGTKCMGFLNIGENLAVIKETSEDDSAVFFIYETSITSKTVTTNTNSGSESETTQEYAYAIKRATSGVGAVSRKCFKTLQDEPLFLSETGVQGITSTNTSSEKVVRNRSRRIDRKLLAEPNLDKAIACVCNGYYYIFINDHVYILDSRHTSSDRKGNTNYVYEAYYWDNVPASCVCVSNGTIYFGTEDGKICRFKNTGQLTDYSDGSHYDAEQEKQVGGVAIPAVYATKNDDDDAPQYFKTMMKKGSMITVAPFANSSVEVYLRVDSSNRKSITDGEVTVSSITTVGSMPMLSTLLTDTNLTLHWEEGTALGGKYTAALVNSGIQYVGSWIAEEGELFTNIDFEHLVFDMRSGPRDFFFRKKKKKYIRLQFVFVNNAINEGFGIHNIVKTYSLTRYAK